MNKEEPLNIENFIVRVNSNELENFIENISCEEEHSILGICRYILNHKRKWQKVINEIQPFLKEYGLAYEDSKDLNIEGENFVIEAIYFDIYLVDSDEYRQAIGF